jgi:hypothetical protein
MAVSNFSGLQINNPQVGIQITKVTDTSADWASVANNTYFYDKGDGLVHYKNSGGSVRKITFGTRKKGKAKKSFNKHDSRSSYKKRQGAR